MVRRFAWNRSNRSAERWTTSRQNSGKSSGCGFTRRKPSPSSPKSCKFPSELPSAECELPSKSCEKRSNNVQLMQNSTNNDDRRPGFYSGQPQTESRATDLDWLAFRYISGEMAVSEAAEFESLLSDDQGARDAVVRAVEL